MRSFILASVAVGLAAAAPAPVPQDIDFDLAYALPNPTYTIATGATAQIVTYNPTSILASAIAQITASPTDDGFTSSVKAKRSACATQASGYGPVPSPDSPSAFLSYSSFASAASAAPTPSGYTQTFQNLQGSNNAFGYLGFTTLKTYDVNACAAKCNAINGCMSINIYFERDPTVDPCNAGDNPSSTTNIKCVFWGGPVNTANAVNTGQWRNAFQVVIAGSNGYMNNTIVSPPGYGTAVPLGNAAINAPYDIYGYNTFLGSAIFNSGPFDASLCAAACSMKSQYAIANPPTDGSPVQTCQFYNTYILYINNTRNLQGQYCAMYSETWPPKYATNVGQYRGYDHFLIEYSYTYSNTTDPGSPNKNGAIYQASQAISYSSLQPYCSTLLGYTTPITTVSSTTATTPITTVTVSATTTVTAAAKLRRDDTSSVSIPASITSIVQAMPYSLAVSSASAANDTATAAQKRAASSSSTPAGLTQYPGSIITSACSLQATPVTQTSTTTIVTTQTAATVTTTITTVVATATAACVPSLSSFRIKISAPGTPGDGAFVQSPKSDDYFVGVGAAGSYYSTYNPNYFALDTGRITTTDDSDGHTIFFTAYDFKNPGQVIFGSKGDTYPNLACSVDPNTFIISCSVPNTDRVKYYKDAPTTWTQFYFGADHLHGGLDNYYQLFIGSQGGDPYGVGFTAVPATLTAVC